MRTFLHLLANTLVANVSAGYLWFAFTFWVYLETKNVMATGIIGGTYLLMVAGFATIFGAFVDRTRKRRVFLLSAAVTAASFAVAATLFTVRSTSDFLDMGGPWFWLLAAVILCGAVVAQLRSIALSTTVTILVPPHGRAKANGLVGTVQGVALIVTSVLSGLSVGLLGMQTTLFIATVAVSATLVHVWTVRIDEPDPARDERTGFFADLGESILTIRAIRGLGALLAFSTLNNLFSGVYVTLIDPYGLTLMPVEWWGVAFAIASTGMVVGGLVIARVGLGPNPLRTMLAATTVMGILGAIFTLREWWPLYLVGIWAYMALMPVVEAAEQTTIQTLVPYGRQGRVFGISTALESAAAPVAAFLVAPLAEYVTVPAFDRGTAAEAWSWMLGEGDARGLAIIFVATGLATVILSVIALTSRAYRRLAAETRGHASTPA
ncbi:MFS transporter [Microbacterium sp.]|uniref:MFS transporter n=1 Tax=Microbacterium sp. TaxID=51671 RepID=UPI0028120864|nr:MFS transporter [Microbacterium sp.]